MDHKHFMEELQKRLPKEKKDLDHLLTSLIEIIREKAVVMDSVSIQGFGIFEPRKKLERITVNPVTGKKMLVPPKIVLSFKPATPIKNKLKEFRNHE